MPQMIRFSMVGAAATGTHVSIGLILSEGLGLPAFWANLSAFVIAIVVSYFGNLVWTFGVVAAGLGPLPRFLVLSLIGLVANQSIVFAVVYLGGWSYRMALVIVVLVVPGLTYLASRYWVFSNGAPKQSGII